LHYNDNFKGFDWKKFQQTLEDPALDIQISSFIARAKEFPFITEDLMNNLEIINDNRNNNKTAIEYS